MQAEHFDLVTRLREGRTNGTSLRWSVTDIHREAADRLEALEAWKAEAMEVLRPFAAENDISDDARDDAWLPINSGDMHVAHCTIGDLRAARRLVEQEDGRG